jgi:hypothetical protein
MALRRVIVRGYAYMCKRTVSLLLALTATLAGCAAGPSADAPPGVVLAGNWKLNHTASDDPQQIIAKMRAQALKIIGRQYGATDAGPRAHTPGGAGGPSAADNPAFGADEPPTGKRGTHGPDPLRYSPMMHVLSAALERGDFLTVRQTSQEFVLDYGTTVRSFTPGAHSVVSAEMGVADQVSGWHGRDYVIDQKAQLGPSVHEEYGLSSDGQHLVEKLRIGPAELPAINLTRVYDRTTETAPRALPTTD